MKKNIKNAYICLDPRGRMMAWTIRATRRESQNELVLENLGCGWKGYYELGFRCRKLFLTLAP